MVSSPLNFKSCGTAEITEPGKIETFFPILAPLIIVTLDPIHVPSPMTTSLSIEVKGSTTTFFAIFAPGCIYESGLIHYASDFLIILANNSASLVNLPSTNACPFM